MPDWLEEFSAALQEKLGASRADLRLPTEAKNPLLGLARVVAHGTERKNAPLATYIAGRFVAARAAEGVNDSAAIAEAVEVAESLAGETE